MKNQKQYASRALTAVILLMACLMAISPLAIFAEGGNTTRAYSTEKNSGVRGEVCTTLDGTGVGAYYTGSYTYAELSEQSADELLLSLRALMTDTHKKQTTYDNCRDYASKTDCQNGDGSVSLLYTGFTAQVSDYLGSGSVGWNREHVWPKSLGGFKTDGAGSDLHHIRPDDVKTNRERDNRKYGNVINGTESTGSALVNGMVGGTMDKKDYFEPLDDVKGDVARICLYVYARYGAEYAKCASITNVFQSVDVLLEWCAMDPVDTWEMGRNEVVAAIQGNRNVFIDYPEYAWLLFGREVPADMTTPSGLAGGQGNVSETESESVSETVIGSNGESETVTEADDLTETIGGSETVTETPADALGGTATETVTDAAETGGCGATMPPIALGVTAMVVLAPATLALQRRRRDELEEQ